MNEAQQPRDQEKETLPIYERLTPDLEKIDNLLSEIAEKRESTVFAIIYSSLTRMHADDIHKIYRKFISTVSNSKKDRVDIVLHTMGGDGDAAFLLGYVIQKYIDELEQMRNFGKHIELNMIILRIAKSAGTLLALCGDCILLTRLSELGPIDPQIPSERGYVSAKTIRDSMKQILEIIGEISVKMPESATLRSEESDKRVKEALNNLLSRIPVNEMGHYESLMNHVTRLAQELLSNRMMKGKHSNEVTEIAKQLVRGYEYHAFPITYWHLKNMGIPCNLVADDIERRLLDMYSVLSELDTKLFYTYLLPKFSPEFMEITELFPLHLHEVRELRNGIIVLPLPPMYIEEFMEYEEPYNRSVSPE